MIKKIILWVLCYWLLMPLISVGQAYKTETGYVKFHSTVPLHSFTGKSKHLVGKINLADSTVDFYLDVHTLKTGIGKRDHDMLETLKAEKHPFASFYGKIDSKVEFTDQAPQIVTVTGKFSIHGVSRKLTIDGTLQLTEDGLKVKASWTLNMKDYNIKPPGILFYRVSENVDISLTATLPKLNSSS